MHFLLSIFVLTMTLQEITPFEDGYLRFVKDSCIIKGEALSCMKYKALKIAKKTIFGDSINGNETIKANSMFSFVPLDEEMRKELKESEKVESSDPRGFLSEWSEVAKYFMKLVQDFFKVKGLRVDLPEGARTITEDDVSDDARGKKKKLAIVIPLLSLMATMKMKFLLIPILLSVLLIKKLLLVAALLLPSLLSTLKACKHPHPMPHYSYFGSNDVSDYSADYGNSYAYSSGGGAYGKDWAASRAYSMPKHRPTAAPVYITAPGNVA